MGTKHGIVVHFVDMVTGKDENVVRIPLLDERNVLVDGIGRAFVPFTGLSGLVRRQDEDSAVGKVEIPGGA